MYWKKRPCFAWPCVETCSFQLIQTLIPVISLLISKSVLCWWSIHLHFFLSPVLGIPANTEAEFLDKIQTKVLRVFLLTIHSHLCSFALRFLFLKFTQPLKVSRVPLLYTVKEKRGKPDRKTIFTKTSSLRTLKIMPRNLNEMVCSWIWLQVASIKALHRKKLLFFTRQHVAMLYFTKIGFGTSKYLIFSSAFGFSYLKDMY